MKGVGCIYVAFGRPYLIQALNSVRTLREFNPTVPVCILTNTIREAPGTFPEWNESVDSWLFFEKPDSENRLIKTDLLRYTPFERTLYLDTDTEVAGDLTSTFRLLDHWDLALHMKEMGYAPDNEKGKQVVLDGQAFTHELPRWGGGIVLFAANPRVERFFELWNQYYLSGKTRYDQVSLVEAVFRSTCRIVSLDARWDGGRAWAKEHPEQKRYVVHYCRDVGDELARRLVELDHRVYGDGVPAGGIDTEAYIRGRQERHNRDARRRDPRLKWVRSVRERLHRVKSRLLGSK